MKSTTTNQRSESGNVLFLILIAVALFAALSYVVTQSTRSGGGSTEREQNILSSASMTQYPTALRTALIRMILNGTAVENLAFDGPDNFATASDATQLVFHPTGGGAVYQDAPANLIASNETSPWYYNANTIVPGIGTDTAGTGNDIIAFLPGVSAGICRQTNEELGIDTSECASGELNSGAPIIDSAIVDGTLLDTMEEGDTFPSTILGTVQGKTGCQVFTRQASGCFSNGAAGPTTKYVFYSVLLER